MEKSLDSILRDCPQNKIIGENFIRAWAKINSPLYKNKMCAISGGSDSDIMLDICSRVNKNNDIQYVWVDTGLEYQATKEHLKYLEDKYGIEIVSAKAIKPIPIACKEYGQPFLSKIVSEYISRLQKHGFQWEDRSYEELSEKYQNCNVALKWWTNLCGEKSRFNISYNKWLKEFMIINPPTFRISNKCCMYAKKNVTKKYKKENHIDLGIVGVRKAEGGARASAYKTCFSCNDDGSDEYRPIWWYLNETKKQYEDAYGIIHSKCYSEYGLKRTGCAGCPYGRDFEYELGIIKKYESKLYVAVNNIFGDSYEYTRKYREFVKEMNQKENMTVK